MRKYILTSIAMLPLLLSCSQAEQNWSVDPPAQPWVFSSDEGGTSSYLGVDITDVTTERLSALKLKEEKGVEVTMVDQDAPAGKAGIKEHGMLDPDDERHLGRQRSAVAADDSRDARGPRSHVRPEP